MNSSLLNIIALTALYSITLSVLRVDGRTIPTIHLSGVEQNHCNNEMIVKDGSRTVDCYLCGRVMESPFIMSRCCANQLEVVAFCYLYLYE